jgi:hypothetical protein
MTDQIAHVFFGFMMVSLLTFIPAPSLVWAGAVLGCTYGLVREVTQMQSSGDYSIGANRLVDIFFWGVGGALAGYLR